MPRTRGKPGAKELIGASRRPPRVPAADLFNRPWQVSFWKLNAIKLGMSSSAKQVVISQEPANATFNPNGVKVKGSAGIGLPMCTFVHLNYMINRRILIVFVAY
jgi:hypothetical protein